MDVRSAFAVGMAGLYILAGLVIGLTPFASEAIHAYRPALALVLVAYGTFRITWWWRRRRPSRPS